MGGLLFTTGGRRGGDCGCAVLGAIVVAVNERLAELRHLALDLDGTIYSGGTIFPETLPFLATLGHLGIGYTFLTNNPSKSIDDYLHHLGAMEVPVTREQLYTSSQATIHYLKRSWPRVRRLFLLGTTSMIAEFSAAGFESVPDDPDAVPDAVVVGFDMSLTYARLCRAAWWISQGKLFLATNPDRVCPTDQPVVLVDCGSICAALETATGRKPSAVLGKPDPAMVQGILDRHGLKPEQVAMVGDRLYTDMTMAHRSGVLGILALTGETNATEAAKWQPAPDLIVSGLDELGRLLTDAQP